MQNIFDLIRSAIGWLKCRHCGYTGHLPNGEVCIKCDKHKYW